MILKRFFYAAVLFLCLPGIASSQNKEIRKTEIRYLLAGMPIRKVLYMEIHSGYILLFLYYMVKMLKNTVRI